MKLFKIAMVAAMLATSLCMNAEGNTLSIVAVNDSHSQIDPASDGTGGVMRRRAIYDYVRSQNPNTLVVHCGDAVQGTVYFSLNGGEVEYALMDSLGYDMIIMGNHEFDNGLDSLAYYYRNVKATKLCANYDVSATKLAGMFEPYRIYTFGGKRVGFFGINVNPQGLIMDKNYVGLRYIPQEKVADATARYLKEVQGVDYAVMLSHIGYTNDSGEPSDTALIHRSHYIDLVIGGHSHTVVKPGSEMSLVPNADGRYIVCGQNGKSAKLVGVYDLNLDNGEVNYRHIEVTKDWDDVAEKSYPAMKRWLGHYAGQVDSLMNNPIAISDMEWGNKEDGAMNWVCDITLDIMAKLTGIKNIDLAIMNKGGIRTSMPRGTVTEGLIMSMFPFDNRYVVLDISGADLIEALGVMAGRGGDALSRGMLVTYNEQGKVTSAKLKGKKIDPKKRYKVATINYLSNGGDYMVPLTRANVLFLDEVPYGDHVMQYVKDLGKAGKHLTTTTEARMVKK